MGGRGGGSVGWGVEFLFGEEWDPVPVSDLDLVQSKNGVTSGFGNKDFPKFLSVFVYTPQRKEV